MKFGRILLGVVIALIGFASIATSWPIFQEGSIFPALGFILFGLVALFSAWEIFRGERIRDILEGLFSL
jgi:uncharacterized membrane protein